MEEYTLEELEQIRGRILFDENLEELEENKNVVTIIFAFKKHNGLRAIDIYLTNGNVIRTFYDK